MGAIVGVVGNINLDLSARLRDSDNPEERRIERLDPGLGGTAANTAVQLTRLGRAVELCGAVGDDPFADWVLAELRAHGVGAAGVQRLAGARTGVCFAAVAPSGERRLYTHRGVNEQAAPRLSAGWTAVHFAGLGVAQLGAVLGGGPLPRPASWCPGGIVTFEHPQEVLRLAESMDLLLCNRAEWDHLARFGRPVRPRVIVTQGAQGALEIGRDLQRPALAIEPLDATGAGDAFNAGFLHGLLSGAEPEICLELGNLMGALCATRSGALGAFGPAEIRAFAAARAPALLPFV